MTNIQEQNRKKGGRPPTGRVRKLSKSVTVKFSKPSYEALRLRARKANRKLAEYIRESALNGEVVSGHNTETVAIAKNLIGMANNLNQLTKLSHQRGFHETHVYVVDLLRRLKEILGEYRQASYKPKPSCMGRKEVCYCKLFKRISRSFSSIHSTSRALLPWVGPTIPAFSS